MYNKYISLLKKNSLKVTPQRLEIMNFLDHNKSHPTVDEIYSKLKSKYPSLSKTTVYNSLEALKQNNIIQAVTISGTESRYDMREDIHHHFLCRRCGKILDIDLQCPNIEKIKNQGYKIEEMHGYFKGICKNCIEKGA